MALLSPLPIGVVRLAVRTGAGEGHVTIRPPKRSDKSPADEKTIEALATTLQQALEGSGLTFTVQVVPTIAAAREGADLGASPGVVRTAQDVRSRFKDALTLAPALIPTLVSDPATWAGLSLASQEDAILYGYVLPEELTDSSTSPQVQTPGLESLSPFCTVRNQAILLYDVLRSAEAVGQLQALHRSLGATVQRLESLDSEAGIVIRDSKDLVERTSAAAKHVGGALEQLVQNFMGALGGSIELAELDLTETATSPQAVSELAAALSGLQGDVSDALAQYEQVEAIRRTRDENPPT